MNEYAEKQRAKEEYVSEKTAEFEKFFGVINKSIKSVINGSNFEFVGNHCGYLFNDEIYKAAVSIKKIGKSESISNYMNLFDSMYEISRYRPEYTLIDIKVDFNSNGGNTGMYIIFIFKDK